MEAHREVDALDSNKGRKYTKNPWTRGEDVLLVRLVQTHGPRSWDSIAAHIPGRTGRSCRLRWGNQLNPRVDRNPFTVEDQQRLLTLHAVYGNRWTSIAHFFPGRTDNQVKNQYHVLVRKRNKGSFNSSSNNDPRGTSDGGSVSLSRFGVESMDAAGSVFSNANNLAAHSSDGGKMPIPVGGSSSMHGEEESRFATHSSNLFGSMTIGGVCIHEWTSRHRYSTMPDANAAAMSRPGSMAQPQQGGYGGDEPFIDFMGVGTSD